jgi:hypothetical protein
LRTRDRQSTDPDDEEREEQDGSQQGNLESLAQHRRKVLPGRKLAGLLSKDSPNDFQLPTGQSDDAKDWYQQECAGDGEFLGPGPIGEREGKP